ncbi:hypothetical protein TcG_11140 [Trypanosoma cruzi]|nr:hypothetical protein TcG_11140 [Trypanosoma cruzi]
MQYARIPGTLNDTAPNRLHAANIAPATRQKNELQAFPPLARASAATILCVRAFSAFTPLQSMCDMTCLCVFTCACVFVSAYTCRAAARHKRASKKSNGIEKWIAHTHSHVVTTDNVLETQMGGCGWLGAAVEKVAVTGIYLSNQIERKSAFFPCGYRRNRSPRDRHSRAEKLCDE